jgi:hypothetical protein
MTIEDEIRALLAHVDETTELLLAAGADRNWALDQLNHEWQLARRLARRAYEQWLHSPGHETYTTYRAAQDRADAAQDVLARRARGPGPEQTDATMRSVTDLEPPDTPRT